MESGGVGEMVAIGGVFGLLLIGIAIVMLITLVPKIFYLLTLQKAFQRCHPANRSMAPAMVWLMFIPFFSLVWHFILVDKLSDSLERESAARGVAAPQSGRSIGLAMCILNACSLIPYVNGLTGIGALVCWVVYWVQVADISSRIASVPAST